MVMGMEKDRKIRFESLFGFMIIVVVAFLAIMVVELFHPERISPALEKAFIVFAELIVLFGLVILLWTGIMMIKGELSD